MISKIEELDISPSGKRCDGDSNSRLRRAQGFLPILAVVVICLLPLVGGLYFRYVSPPKLLATVGTPLSPVELPFDLLLRYDGTRLIQPTVNDKWLVVVTAPGNCDEQCLQALYLTRQARTAQGRNMTRIERLWLVSDGEKPADELLKAHPDLTLAKAIDSRVKNILGEADVPTIHLVDRRGLVVYRYPYDCDPKSFINEIGKLIKN